MEFWGVEVKAGQPLKVEPNMDEIIHISQAALGESKKKGDESATIFVKFDDKKLVLGHLSAEKFPQIPFDLVFEKEFELSHNWSGGSVYFTGYSTSMEEQNDFSDMGTDSEEDELQMGLEQNGKIGLSAVPAKPADAAKSKSSEKPKAAEAAKGKEEKVSDSDADDEDGDDLDEDDSDEEMGSDSEADSDDDEEDSDEDDEEETPKKAEVGKKRPNESASKTPDVKKAKLATPQKTDGKKGGVHIATPHPAKQAGKTPASNKKQQQTPKSGGSVTCNSCSKTFNSEGALQSHSKAKHGAK